MGIYNNEKSSTDKSNKKLLTDKCKGKTLTDQCEEKLLIDQCEEKLSIDKCKGKTIADGTNKKTITDKSKKYLSIDKTNKRLITDQYKEHSLLSIEKDLVKKKDWQFLGEVDKTKRPINSLLNKKEIKYDVTEQIEPISSKQNNEILKMTLQRLREGTFDNYDFTETKVEEEEIEYNEEDNKDIVELYNEIESELLKISDFGSFGFMPDFKIRNVDKAEVLDNKKRKSVKTLGNIKNVTVLK